MKNTNYTTNTHTSTPWRLFEETLTLIVFLSVVGISSVVANTFSATTVIDLVNQSRTDAGLNALTEDAKLTQAAQAKADDMIRNNYFAHTSPSGVTPWYWLEKVGYNRLMAGENLAIRFSDAETEHNAWMASPKHRENILNPKYTQTGVAVAEETVDGKTSIIAVEFFGTPIGAVVPVTKQTPVVPEASAVKSATNEVSSQSIASVPESVTIRQMPTQTQTYWALILIGVIILTDLGIFAVIAYRPMFHDFFRSFHNKHTL